MEGPVGRLRLLEQLAADALPGLGDDAFIGIGQRLDLFRPRLLGEAGDRLLLQDDAELEGVADELQVDRGDLHAALGNGDDQTVGLEPRNQLADGAQRHARQRHQLALGDELARTQVERHQPLLEALIGLFAKLHHDECTH